MAAYIPPHERHSKEGSSSPKPTPAPESLINKTNLTFKKEKHLVGGIHYAHDAVSKWFTVGLTAHDDPSLLGLQPVPVEGKPGYLPLSLVLIQGCSEGKNELMDKPWKLVAENVMQDLLLSFQHVKREMDESNMEEVKPTLVGRFGRILFYGKSSNVQESLKHNPLDETMLKQMKKSFYTNIPPPYMEYLGNLSVEKLGLDHVEEKELYYVKLSDNSRADSTVSCKCTVAKDHKKIQLYKIEVNQVRHMVADMSCLGKSSDLRLMLHAKKKITMALSNEEINGIKDLIGSAILDSKVKGGLRWPFGKDSSGGRYAVIGVWHTTAKSYGNSSIRFKLRHADRFDFRSSTGEVAREASLKMPGIISELRKQTIEENLVFEMLKDNLKFIWDHCLLDGSSS